MGFDAETYRRAAVEHMTVAHELYQSSRYVLCHYVAGLAVECIFRAYRIRVDPAFDARHDLKELYKTSRYIQIVPEKEAGKYGACLSEVVVRWNNSHRFRSERALATYLKAAGLNRGIKGGFEKENSRRILNAATELVSLGAGKWNS